MTDNPPPNQELKDELRNLGQNLVDALRATWNSPERRRLQDEVTAGLTDLTTTIKQEADHIQESPTGQRLRTEVDDLHQRVRDGEIENQLRTELLGALRIINQELQKVVGHWNVAEKPPASEPPVDAPPSDTQPGS